MAIVGAGNLGQALASYGGFPARGFHVVAAFDVDPAKVGIRLGQAVVHPTASHDRGLRRTKRWPSRSSPPRPRPPRAWRTPPWPPASASILNFAPTTVTVPARVALRQVDLGIELQILSFYEQQQARRLAPAAGR